MNDKWDMVKSRGKSRDASVNSLGGIQSVVYEVSVGWFLFPNLVDVTSWFNLEDWGTMCIRNLQWNIVRVNPTRWGICNTANYSFAMNTAGHGYEEWNGWLWIFNSECRESGLFGRFWEPVIRMFKSCLGDQFIHFKLMVPANRFEVKFFV